MNLPPSFSTKNLYIANFYHIPGHQTESTTLALLGTGLIGMVLYGRKKKMLNN